MTERRTRAAALHHVAVYEEGGGVERHRAIVLHGGTLMTRFEASRDYRRDLPDPCSRYVPFSGRSRPQVARGLAGPRTGATLAGVPPSTSTRGAGSVRVPPKYPSPVAAPPIGTDAGVTGNPS